MGRGEEVGGGEEVRRCSTAVLVRVHLKLQAKDAA